MGIHYERTVRYSSICHSAIIFVESMLHYCLFDMILRVLLAFLMILTRTSGNGITVKFVEEFFAKKCISQIVVFACWDYFEGVNFYRDLTKSNVKLSYISISNDLDMKSILRVDYYKLGAVLDLDCPQGENVLEQFSKDRLPYNESYFWLMVTKALTPPKDLLSQLPLTIETELTLATRWNDSYILYDIYNPSYRHGGRLNVTYTGHWNPKDGLGIELVQYKYKRRGDLQGLSLNFSIAASDLSTLDLMISKSGPVKSYFDTPLYYNYALLLYLRDSYNFTMNLVQTSSWGYLVNGTFNGMLRDMITGLVDIGVSPMQFKMERLDVVEYTVQSYIARIIFIFRHPKGDDAKNIFLGPFRNEVWWFVLIVSIVYWLLLWLVVKFELCSDKRPLTGTLDSHPASESGLITVAAICQQGSSDEPGLCSGRVMFISLFVWGLLLYQFYSANVVGSLLTEPPRHINNLKALLDSNLRVGITDIDYNYDYFTTTTDPVILELHRRKVMPNARRKKPAYYKPAEGIRKVQRGGFAFLVEDIIAYKIISNTFTENEICDLTEIHVYPYTRPATVTSKHSPFKKMVTYGLRRIVECGVTERLLEVWRPRRPKCTVNHSSTPVPVSLEEFYPALVLLFIGLAMAIIIVLIEKCVRRQINRRRRILMGTVRQGWTQGDLQLAPSLQIDRLNMFFNQF